MHFYLYFKENIKQQSDRTAQRHLISSEVHTSHNSILPYKTVTNISLKFPLKSQSHVVQDLFAAKSRPFPSQPPRI